MMNNGGIVDEMVSNAKAGKATGPGTRVKEDGNSRGANNSSKGASTSSDRGPGSGATPATAESAQVGNGVA